MYGSITSFGGYRGITRSLLIVVQLYRRSRGVLDQERMDKSERDERKESKWPNESQWFKLK